MQPLSENTYTTAFPTYLTLRRAQLLCQGQVPSECKKGIAPHPKKTVLRDGAKQGKIPTINLPFGGERGGRRELETPVIQASCMQPLSENTYTTAFPTYLTLRRAQLLCQGQVPSECKKGIAPHPKKTVLRDGAKQGKIPTINLPFHASLTRLPQIFVGQRESMVASVPEG